MAEQAAIYAIDQDEKLEVVELEGDDWLTGAAVRARAQLRAYNKKTLYDLSICVCVALS